MGVPDEVRLGPRKLAALALGYLAATCALGPQPFYLGVAFALAGLLLSILFVRDSHGHARQEARDMADGKLARPSFRTHAGDAARQAPDCRRGAARHTRVPGAAMSTRMPPGDRMATALSEPVPAA